MSGTTIASDSIDALIAHRLPTWLTAHGRIDRLHGLRLAMQRQEKSAAALRTVLAAIPDLHVFAEQLLQAQLRKYRVVGADLRRCWVTVEHERIRLARVVGWPIPRYADRTSSTLLAAALHNFHITETRPSSRRRGKVVNHQGTHLAIGYLAFAGLCRAVDVGGQYQRVLKGCLCPEDAPGQTPGAGQTEVHARFEEHARASLEVALRQALFKGDLDETCYLMLLAEASAVPTVPAVAGHITVWQPRLLGKRLRGVLAFELRNQAGGPVQAIVAWVPDDPRGAIGQHRSWEALYQTLGVRLSGARYRAFFGRFIAERDRVAFQPKLLERLHAVKPGGEVQLDGRHEAVDTPWHVYLRTLRIDTLLDDARVLATPTGDEDQRDRVARLQGYAEAGLDLLGLAGMFVPVLGEALLAVSAVGLANEVYEGYQDWRIGDREAALDHLFGIAETLAEGAVVAAAGAGVGSLLRRHAFVDQLQPVYKGREGVRLAAPDLPGYALETSSCGPFERLWHWQERLYRVVDHPQDGRPRIVHPTRDAAHAPLLYDNGSDGWYHELELPQSWQGATLLRRFSGRLALLRDDTADYLMQVTGFEEAQLRRMHLERMPAPARLLDALDLYQVHEGDPDLRGDALDEAFASHLENAYGSGGMLARSFPSLSLREVTQLLDQASSAELNELLDRQKVPLTMAERARWQLYQSRLDRAFAGLRLSRAANADSEQLALGLIQASAPWPADVRVELRATNSEGALLAAVGPMDAARTQTLVRTPTGYRVLGGDGREHGLAGALRRSLSAEQYELLQDAAWDSPAFARWLLKAASQDRERAARLCGLTQRPRFAPPRRVGDGRLGYPLSGRAGGGRHALRQGIQQIFPTLSGDELQQYLMQVIEQGTGLWEHYMQLQDQLTRLRDGLRLWRRQASGVLDRLRRRRVANALRRSWRRKITNAFGEYVVEIEGEAIGALPSLPEGVRFDHVQRLSLRDLDLEHIDDDFLERFPNVVELDLASNRLSSLPYGLRHLRHLRTLRLEGNRIVLDDGSDGYMAELTQLHLLDLSYNPLGRAPLLGPLRNLRNVSLRETGLRSLPTGFSASARLDLRGNAIEQVREDLRRLRLRMDGLSLHDNPLDATSVALLDEARGAASAPHASAPHASPRRHASEPLERAVFDLYADGLSARERFRRQATWDALRDAEGSSSLFRFLTDFACSEDFETDPGHYRPRLWRVLEVCEQHANLRQRLFMLAAGPRTCEDRLLMILEQLELGVLVERAMHEGPVATLEQRLYQLGQGLWRLDEVDSIAQAHVQRLRAANRARVDPLETQLFYRQELRTRLGLPLADDAMHYPEYAHVLRSDIEHAAQRILQAETHAAIAVSLSQRPFWESYVRERYPARFDEAMASINLALEKAEAQLATGEINENAYLTACERLKQDYQARERALLLQLAKEAQARSTAPKPQLPPTDRR